MLSSNSPNNMTDSQNKFFYDYEECCKEIFSNQYLEPGTLQLPSVLCNSLEGKPKTFQ